MSSISLQEFADKLNEVMQAIFREYIKQQAGGFHNLRLTPPQFIILECLSRQGESRMSDLAHYMKVTTAAMTGIVDRLARDGYIERCDDPGDRRIVKVRLTRKGLNMVKDMLLQKRKMVVNLFSKVSQAERESYLNILTNIRERLKQA